MIDEVALRSLKVCERYFLDGAVKNLNIEEIYILRRFFSKTTISQFVNTVQSCKFKNKQPITVQITKNTGQHNSSPKIM